MNFMNNYPVVLFENVNWWGEGRGFTVGEVHDLGADANKFMSAKVAPGFRLIAYEHPNFEGQKWTYSEDNPYIYMASERINSLRVEQIRYVYRRVPLISDLGSPGVRMLDN